MDDDDSYASYGSSEYNEDMYGDTSVGTPPQEEIRFENEYNVYERVGGYQLGELGTSDAVVGRDPIQQFTNFVQIVAKEMVSQGVIGLKRPDIHYILTQIPYIPNVKYKNPTGVVLGFWVIRNGAIDNERINNLLSSLESLTYPIRNYDVIRYANLWLQTGLYYTG